MDKALFARFAKCAAEVLSVDVTRVGHAARLRDDLGVDSLDLVEFVMAIEEEFGVEIAESHLDGITTVGQAFALLERLLMSGKSHEMGEAMAEVSGSRSSAADDTAGGGPNRNASGAVRMLETSCAAVAEKLKMYLKSGGEITGSIDEVANKIWRLGQGWLVFFDGADFEFTKDRDLHALILGLALMNRCSVEEEAQRFMAKQATDMSKYEIALGLWVAVETIGSVLVYNGSFEHTYNVLISGRHRSGIPMPDNW
jgi:acyl carrier protein